MIVRTKEHLKGALKSGERNIEILGPYAEEVMRKYHKEIATPHVEVSPALAVCGGPIVLEGLKAVSVAGRLQRYKLISYSREKLVLEKTS